MSKEPIFLDTYLLQQDMRIRLPKAILNNLPVKKGHTMFSIYLDQDKQELILRICEQKEEDQK